MLDKADELLDATELLLTLLAVTEILELELELDLELEIELELLPILLEITARLELLLKLLEIARITELLLLLLEATTIAELLLLLLERGIKLLALLLLIAAAKELLGALELLSATELLELWSGNLELLAAILAARLALEAILLLLETGAGSGLVEEAPLPPPQADKTLALNTIADNLKKRIWKNLPIIFY